MAHTASGENGFIATVSEGFAEGFATLGSQVLPMWTAREFDLQTFDQLRNPTFDPAFADIRLDDLFQQTFGLQPQPTGFQSSTEAIGRTLLIAGAAIIAVMLVMR